MYIYYNNVMRKLLVLYVLTCYANDSNNYINIPAKKMLRDIL